MQPMLPSWWRRIRRFWLLFPIFLRFLKEEEEERTEGAPSRRREKEWAGRSEEEDRSTCHAQAKRTLRYLSFFPHLHCTLQSEKARGGRQRSIQPASLFGSSNFASGLRYPHTSLSLPLASAGLLCWLGWQQHPPTLHGHGTALHHGE